MLHAKLGRWFQPGGHADGDATLPGVAWREATEETGVTGLTLAVPAIDLDVHEVGHPTAPTSTSTSATWPWPRRAPSRSATTSRSTCAGPPSTSSPASGSTRAPSAWPAPPWPPWTSSACRPTPPAAPTRRPAAPLRAVPGSSSQPARSSCSERRYQTRVGERPRRVDHEPLHGLRPQPVPDRLQRARIPAPRQPHQRLEADLEVGVPQPLPQHPRTAGVSTSSRVPNPNTAQSRTSAQSSPASCPSATTARASASSCSTPRGSAWATANRTSSSGWSA